MPSHTPARKVRGIFKNNHPNDGHRLSGTVKWLWQARSDLPNFKKVLFPKAPNDPAFLASNRSQRSLTWVGHATFLAQLGGLNVLTDPVFAQRTSPIAFAGPRRLSPLGLELAELPPIDIVLISHNHYDHLCAPSIHWLAQHHPQALFVVPLGVADWFKARGYRHVVELDWWQASVVAGATVTAVPAQHFSGRGLHDRNRSLWCGFVLQVAEETLFFAGDTGYSPDFKAIGAAFPNIDMALLPIGAYNPRGFMKSVHIDPAEAVQIFADLGAQQAAAMHWGTFRLTLEPLDEPPVKLAHALSAQGIAPERFRVMQHGETWCY